MNGQPLARFVAELKRQLANVDEASTPTGTPLRLHRVEADIDVITESSPETDGGVRLFARMSTSNNDATATPGPVHRVRLEFTANDITRNAPVPPAASSTIVPPAPGPSASVPVPSVLAGLGVEFRTLDELSRSEKLPSYLRALLVRKDLPESDKALVLANVMTLEGDLARHGFVGDILMALDAAELERRLAKTGSAAPPKQ